MLAERVFDTPEVWRLQVPFQNVVTTETNVYVVRDGDDVLVVDMGADSDEGAAYLTSALAELGITPEQPRYFFTHLHMDHSGLVDRMLPPETPLYINSNGLRAADPRFAEWMASYAGYRFQEEGMPQAQAACISAPVEISTPIDVPCRNVVVTAEGDVVRVGRHAFCVIDLPGHTRGMQGLYHPESGICFSGDQLLFVLSPAIGLFLDHLDSMTAYSDSMHKLLGLDISQLFHSHGDIRPDFRERGESILAHHDRRIDEVARIVAEAVAQGERPTGMQVAQRIAWKIPFASIGECEPLQQWLIYAQGVMLLDHAVSTGRIERHAEPACGNEATLLHRYSV